MIKICKGEEGGVSMDEIKSFPHTAEEALAMLYVSKVMSAESKPEEYLKHYTAALARIKAEAKRIRNENSKGEQKVSY